MNGIGDLKKNHRWKFILHVNLHRRYYVCGGFFLVQNMIVMQANLPLFTSNDLKPFLILQ